MLTNSGLSQWRFLYRETPRHGEHLPAGYLRVSEVKNSNVLSLNGPLILHGDDDQIVPIGASAMMSSKLVEDATLKVYKSAPHGMCTTLKDRVNEDLLAFLE